MENAGILDVFPIFHAARLGQKIRRSPQLPLCGVALIKTVRTNLLFMSSVYSAEKGIPASIGVKMRQVSDVRAFKISTSW